MEEQNISQPRRLTLLTIFCLTQFIDVFNFGAMFVAVPTIQADLSITTADSIWIVSAFQLTFASFLLVSGRISDIYDPKYVFVSGMAILGLMSLGCGFVRTQIPLFVLRALAGVGASLTIPSALGLIVRLYPDPNGQALAIAVFGGSGAFGNALGIIFSALFVERAKWYWLFWFITLISFPLCVVGLLLIPTRPKADAKKASLRSLDAGGVSILTSALILFIFALTSAPNVGWGTARVIAPLVISVFMVAGFLWWETRVPEEYASLPPRMWFYPNFSAIMGISISPYLWWTAMLFLVTTHWLEAFHWSALKASILFLPIGLLALPLTILIGYITRYVKPKYILLVGGVLQMASTALGPFIGLSDSGSYYWRFAFPSFILGTCGSTFVYAGASIAIFQATPPAYAATVGAVFNSSLQLGSAVGSAIISSIQASVVAGKPAGSYDGRAAGFWFLFAVVTISWACVVIFYRADRRPDEPNKEATPSVSGVGSEKGSV